MTVPFFRKKWRQVKRWAKRSTMPLLACALLLLVVVSVYLGIMNRRLSVDPTTYTSLLNLIARVESRDNYNAYFGNAGNTQVEFTAMSIAEVQEWQEDFIGRGNPSSAVGRYQIISTTLASLVDELDLDVEQQFDKATQDKLAMKLLERRGSEAYVNDELTQEEFAANLAMEWAALPKVLGDNPTASYYAGDGLNASLVEVDEVLKTIEPIRAK